MASVLTRSSHRPLLEATITHPRGHHTQESPEYDVLSLQSLMNHRAVDRAVHSIIALSPYNAVYCAVIHEELYTIAPYQKGRHMPSEDVVNVATAIADMAQSKEFKKTLYTKFYEPIEALAIAILGDEGIEKAHLTMDVIEDILALSRSNVGRLDSETSQAIAEVIHTYVSDTLPLFHAYVIDLVDEVEAARA